MLPTIQEDQAMDFSLSICSDYSTLDGIPVLEIKVPGYINPPEFDIISAFSIIAIMAFITLILFNIDPYYGLAGVLITIFVLFVILIQQLIALQNVIRDSSFARSSGSIA